MVPAYHLYVRWSSPPSPGGRGPSSGRPGRGWRARGAAKATAATEPRTFFGSVEVVVTEVGALEMGVPKDVLDNAREHPRPGPRPRRAGAARARRRGGCAATGSVAGGLGDRTPCRSRTLTVAQGGGMMAHLVPAGAALLPGRDWIGPQGYQAALSAAERVPGSPRHPTLVVVMPGYPTVLPGQIVALMGLLPQETRAALQIVELIMPPTFTALQPPCAASLTPTATTAATPRSGATMARPSW